MIFDTHTHYDDEQFDQDREQVFSYLKENQIKKIVNVGASFEGCKKTMELAKKYSWIYGALGIHPDEIGSLDDKVYQWIKEHIRHEKIVAVGEIGLDYHWMVEPKEKQWIGFRKQMELAFSNNLPIIVHSRDASRDTFECIQKYGQPLEKKTHRGIIHAYSGSLEMAKEYVKMGYVLGIGGVVTFKNGKKLKEVVQEIPLEHLVMETDCPYLSPEPFRGKRNDSSRLVYVAEEIGRLKGISKEKVIEQTYENAKRLFQV